MAECNILLDVGGTGIKGVATDAGAIPDTYTEFPARSGEGRETILSHFTDIIHSLSAQRAVHTVAFAFPGPFDYKNGVPLMRSLAKYESIYGCCLPKELQAHGCAVADWFFINDVAAYALGIVQEMALKGHCLCVCLGTGAGSAFCVNGHLAGDRQEGVPENGWIYTMPFKDSIIDDYLSDRGIKSLSCMMLGQEYSPKQLNDMAAQGDRNACRVWQLFGENTACALKEVLQSFHADTLVIGGKIALAADWFSESLRRLCDELRIRLIIAPDTTKYVLVGLNSILEKEKQED